MSATLTLQGSLEVGGSCAAACSGAGDRTIRRLSLRCTPGFYQSVVDTPVALVVQTTGLPGAQFVDLDVLDALDAIEFLYARSNAKLVLRIGADEAVLTASGGTYPTAFVGGETLLLTIDAVPVSVVFDVGDQTAPACAARINAACALAGLPTPRATVATSGQLAIRGTLTGTSASVVSGGGTGAVTLGLPAAASANGAGSDVAMLGTFLVEFPTYPDAPRRIQVSGQANLSLVAAGRTSV